MAVITAPGRLKEDDQKFKGQKGLSLKKKKKIPCGKEALISLLYHKSLQGFPPGSGSLELILAGSCYTISRHITLGRSRGRGAGRMKATIREKQQKAGLKALNQCFFSSLRLKSEACAHKALLLPSPNLGFFLLLFSRQDISM